MVFEFLKKNKYQKLGTEEPEHYGQTYENPMHASNNPWMTSQVPQMSALDTMGVSPWDVCKNIPAPPVCERCRQYPPTIRALNKDVGSLEFICQQCRLNDPKLNTLPVKPRNKT